jgi:hypothetical protein
MYCAETRDVTGIFVTPTLGIRHCLEHGEYAQKDVRRFLRDRQLIGESDALRDPILGSFLNKEYFHVLIGDHVEPWRHTATGYPAFRYSEEWCIALQSKYVPFSALVLDPEERDVILERLRSFYA